MITPRRMSDLLCINPDGRSVISYVTVGARSAEDFLSEIEPMTRRPCERFPLTGPADALPDTDDRVAAAMLPRW